MVEEVKKLKMKIVDFNKKLPPAQMWDADSVRGVLIDL